MSANNAMTVHIKRVNRWRSAYNPLRALNMQRVVTLLEAGQRGEFANLEWLYRTIERRDATIRALKQRRIAALKRLDWNIKTVPENEMPPGATPDMAKKQAETLRTAYDGIDNLAEAVGFIELAEFRGFSHLEKHYDRDFNVVHLEPVEQWHWVRDGINGEWKYDPESRGTLTAGQDIDLANFIIREIDDPIDEVAIIAFMRKNLSQKDWDAFIEVFGVPPTFIIGPPNTDPDKEKEYQEIAEDIVGDGRGYLPHGADVKNPTAQVRGTNPFRDHIKYQDEQVVLAGTGGKLTMLTESGSGTLAGGAHEDTFDDIAEAEAVDISEIFRAQNDAAILNQHHEGQPVLAYFDLAARDVQDIGQVVTHAKDLSTAGYVMDTDDLAERTGYKITPKSSAPPSPGEPSDPRGASVGNRLPTSRPVSLKNRSAEEEQAAAVGEQLLDAAETALANAQANDLQPLRERLANIMQIEDPVFRQNALRNLRNDLPQMLIAMNAEPEAAQALEESMSSGLINGWAEAATTHDSEVAA